MQNHLKQRRFLFPQRSQTFQYMGRWGCQGDGGVSLRSQPARQGGSRIVLGVLDGGEDFGNLRMT
jgi:hypothetical protein